MFGKVFRVLNIYRVDVYLLYSVFMLGAWSQAPIPWGGLTDPRVIVWAVFFLGLVWIYLFNKTCDRVEDKVSQPDEMLSEKENLFMVRTLPVLLIVPIVILVATSMPVWPFLLYISLGFLYSYPVWKGVRLKNIFVVKTIIAGVNMLSPLWFGLFLYFTPFYTHLYVPHMGFLIGLFLVYITGELVWDIRDVDGDRDAGVRTIPVVLGVRSTQYVAGGLLVSALYFMPHVWVNYIALAIVGLFVVFANKDRPRWFFHLMLYVLIALLMLYMLWT